MKLVAGVHTDVGRVRQGNEDSYVAESPLFGVADGMGGHLAGDVASDTAVRIITDRFRENPTLDPEELKKSVRAANYEIWTKAQRDSSLRGMGTTCTLVFLDDNHAHFAHVGDSRAYLRRDGELSQLTEDHTLVGRMVREGRMRPEDAEHHPQRSIITRALGVDHDVQVDLFTIRVRHGDRLLLCSDGLTSMVDPGDINRTLGERDDPQAAAEQLVRMANDAGGEDNVTVLVIDVRPDGNPGSGTSVAHNPLPQDAGSPPQATASWEAPRPPAREFTPPEAGLGPPPGRPARRRWPLWTLLTLLILAGAFVVARWTLSNSWYVGVNEADKITIFRGIPEDIAGFTYRQPEEVTGIELADLPEFLRGNFESGRKVDSLEEARAVVADLENQVEEFRRQQRPRDGAGDGAKP